MTIIIMLYRLQQQGTRRNLTTHSCYRYIYKIILLQQYEFAIYSHIQNIFGHFLAADKN
jgi:hypothetical protein